jgi:hypothetical protein
MYWLYESQIPHAGTRCAISFDHLALFSQVKFFNRNTMRKNKRPTQAKKPLESAVNQIH